MNKFVPRNFRKRIEKLMGADLRAQDLSFLGTELPLRELERLQKFCAINSATLNREGVAQMQDLVSESLQSMGFEIHTVKGEERFAHLVIAERPGRQRDKYITLVTHTDTVLSNFREFTVDAESGLGFGSGVIDNKGGVVVGLSALERFLRHSPQTEYSLRFVCSPNEEMGSIGFIDLYRQLAADTFVAFGLEPALSNGSIIHQRRGNRWYEVSVEGREAHAGRSYGEHANAAHDMAEKIVALSRLTNYAKHMSVTVARVEGGKDRFNIVCGDAAMKLDVRFATMEQRDWLHRKIEKILGEAVEKSVCGKYQTRTEWKVVDDCPPFSLTRQAKKLARRYAALCSELEGKKVYSQPAGGAGDVNYLSAPHNVVLDGFGPFGGEMHTRHEFVDIGSLTSRSKALAGFLNYMQTVSL